MAEFGLDQAAGLRRLSAPQPVKVIAVTGGKGGVGKSNVAINLGTALCQLGRRVMVLDADLGLANVDVLLGLRARFNLEHVIDGTCALQDVILTARSGLHIVPASSGNLSMATLDRAGQAGLIHAFSELFEPLDVLLIDTAAGLSESVLTFSEAAQQVVVVVCDEPASLTDAYGLIKVLRRRQADCRIQVITNMTESAGHGRALYEKLARVSHRFLGVSPGYFGNISYDEHLRRAVQRQSAVIEAYPSSRSAREFKKLAVAADNWKATNGARGGLEFFVERLVGTKAPDQEGFLQ
jgi:flagellar biosynthesis protein FlhG